MKLPVMTLALALVATSACKKKVNTSNVEGTIRTQLEGAGLEPETVKCPEGVEVKVGTTFNCTITIGGKTYEVAETITEVDGMKFSFTTRWAGIAPISKAKLEEVLTPSVREQTEPEVEVTCGAAAVIDVPADGVVWCDIGAGDKQAKIKITLDPDQNIKDWEVATPP